MSFVENSKLISLDIPIFESASSEEEESRSEKSHILLPVFSPLNTPQTRGTHPGSIYIPTFSATVLPAPSTQKQIPLKIPDFSSYHFPLPLECIETSIHLPIFLDYPSPQPKDEKMELLENPTFLSDHSPIPTITIKKSVKNPEFVSILSPRPENKENSVLEEVMFKSFEEPIAKHNALKNIQIAPPYVSHPIMKDFHILSKEISYDEILELAIRHGSMGDVRMLKKHSLLEKRYLKLYCEEFIVRAPSLLPQSNAFKTWLEIDQVQIDLLTQFCTSLTETYLWEKIDLAPHPLMRRLLYFSSSKQDVYEAYEKGLLKFKNFIFCFLSEILEQEQRDLKKFGATHKNLIGLAQALHLLAKNIQNSADELNMQVIHEAERLQFSLWEDRVPIKHETTEPEGYKTTPDLKIIQDKLTVLQKERPPTHVLNDFIDHVLSLPQCNQEEASVKAHYLLELAKVYFRYPKLSSLKQSIGWIDLAITTLSEFLDLNPTTVQLCYDLRGMVWLKIAQEVEIEESLIRKRKDISFRDFHKSSSLISADNKNFVRKLHEAKQNNKGDLAIHEISDVIEIDDDYAEAHYLNFLRQFKQNQLNSSQLLNPQYEILKTKSVSEILSCFQGLLLKKQKNVTIFKITSHTGTAFLKFDPKTISITQVGVDFLISLLTKGAKKVQPIPNHSLSKKIYFSSPISAASFLEIVQSMGSYQKRLREIEKCIHAFHDFEIASLYKSTLVDTQEKLDCNSVRTRLDKDLLLYLIDLHTLAAEKYLLYGKTQYFLEAKKTFAIGLAYACRAISDCDRLLNTNKEQQDVKAKKLALLIKKAFLYRYMGLTNCHIASLNEAIAFGKQNNSRYLNPSLHNALGIVYKELGRKEEAEIEFCIVRSAQKYPSKINKKEQQRLDRAAKRKNKPLNEKIPDDQAEIAILAAFQDKNILEECLQIIKDHHKVNAKIHLHRTAPYWDFFIEQINKTLTIQEFCEVIFSFVSIREKVVSENLLKISQLANISFKNSSELDQIKAYVLDAVEAHLEEEKKQQDVVIANLEEAKAATLRVEAFSQFKTELIKKLKEGERIRPGSLIRKKILELSSLLQGFEIKSETILQLLAEIIEESIDPNLLIVNEEIDEILNTALEIVVKTSKINDDVFQITGNNVFLSQVIETIKKACKNDPSIHNIHILGINVYVDIDLYLPGINVALGGEHGEFLMDKGVSGRDNPRPLSINLSGNKGENGPPLNLAKAGDGNHPCDNGRDGVRGNDGEGGMPGGDFCINLKEPVVGLNSSIVQEINLAGGDGGTGSDGQPGGNGAKGIKGVSGREDVKEGDPADSNCGFIDVRRGTRGTPGGDGGKGGDCGLGGKGGAAGRLLIEPIPTNLSIKTDPGNVGGDGQPGLGGKGGKGKADGLDYAIVKGSGWILGKIHKFHGHGLYIINSDKDREKDGWTSAYTRAETKGRNQGRERGNGLNAQNQARNRRAQAKHNLKRELFNANLAQHIHNESPENKAFAFDSVTNRLAAVHDTEEIIQEQLTAKQKKIKDIETLHETTSSLLRQSQTQQHAQTQHTRSASFAKLQQDTDLKKAIEVYFKNPQRDLKNKLPFQECSPIDHSKEPFVIHDLEVAMHAVNTTKGQSIAAIAKLIFEIVHFSEKSMLGGNKERLIAALPAMITEMPLKYAACDFIQIVKVCRELEHNNPLIKAVAKKNKEVWKYTNYVEEQKAALNKAFQAKIQEISLCSHILHFLQRDRLFILITIKDLDTSERQKKERWFKERLYQKIVSYVRFITKTKSTEETPLQIVKTLESYATQVIKEAKTEIQKNSLLKVFREHFSSRRKNLEQQRKTLQHNQEWFLNHLHDLIELNISPKKMLKDGLENLYDHCFKKWINSSSPIQNPQVDPEVPLETISQETRWIHKIGKKEWNPLKFSCLESHIKKLIELKNPEPFLKELANYYAKPIEFEDLPEIFVTLAQAGFSCEDSYEIIKRLESTDLKSIYRARRRTLQQLHKKDNGFYQVDQIIYNFLEKRHLFLMQEECLQALSTDQPSQDRINSVISQLLIKANQLYACSISLNIDFLQLAKQVLIDAFAKSIDVDVKGPDFFHLLLQRAVRAPFDLQDHKKLISILKNSLEKNKKIESCLFLLVNLDLSYAELTKVIQLLNVEKLSHIPAVKKALNIFLQKSKAQQCHFEQKWHYVLEQGKFYDQILAQVEAEGISSIELLLYNISTEIDLLPPDKKINCLSRLMEIVSEGGCFTMKQKIKAVQNKLITKMGVFPVEIANDSFLQYNNALKTAFKTGNNLATLPQLFIQIMQSPFKQDFLIPSLIAIKHLTWSSEQLITLYRKIDEYSTSIESEVELKKACLHHIRSLLVKELQNQSQLLFQQQSDVRSKLLKAQSKAINKFSEILKSTQIIYADRHIAKFELWLKLLDDHFEINSSDYDGEERKKLYKKATRSFLEEMQSQAGLEDRLSNFHRWLRTQFNDLSQSHADSVLFDQVIDQLQDKNTSEKACKTLKKLYWRGVIPYSDSSESVLHRIEDKNLEKDVLNLLKLKFDDSMIQEECYEVKKELRAVQQKSHEEVTVWIANIQTWLSSYRTGEEIEHSYPQADLLETIIHTYQTPPKAIAITSMKDEEFILDDWIQASISKTKDSIIPSPPWEKIEEYLEDLAQKLEEDILDQVDAVMLKNLRKALDSCTTQKKHREIHNKVDALEMKIIDLADAKEHLKNKIINDFLFFYVSPRSKNSVIAIQDENNFIQLKKSIASCQALMQEEQFLACMIELTKVLGVQKKPINITVFTHIFWALPRLDNCPAFFDVIKNKLPENWAVTLLELHCQDVIQPALSKMIYELPPLSLHSLSLEQRDELIAKTLKEREQHGKECFINFRKALNGLTSSSLIRPKWKEALLRLLAERLGLLNQGNLRFSIEEFIYFLSNYLISPEVIKKLSSELPKPRSTIANILFQPSFEAFKYGLEFAWIHGMLEPPLLNLTSENQQRLLDSLFEIETIKKEGMMRAVVESLQGDLMTPAVVQCIVHFASRSWELDSVTLNLLKNRNDTGEWYAKIEKYTKEKRAKPRDLASLVDIMAEEGIGINSSINHLLIGKNPQLIKDIEEIKQLFEEVSDWKAEDIKDWARKNKGAHFLDNSKNLKKGIAVVSRANQIVDKHSLRDTQLIALWLMLRQEEGKHCGRISQMFTGEGKSITFGCLAVLRAMADNYVDVITTSFLLAARDAESKKDLFDLFELTVSNNCDTICESDEEIRKSRYFNNNKPVDIIYGDVGAFERDLLLTEFHGLKIIHESRLGKNRTVLVDEVDGLFLDNASMVLYLSHNVDTLRFLERIFAQIWTLANHSSFQNSMPYDDKAIDGITKLIKKKIESNEILLPKYSLPHAKYMEIEVIIARKLPTWIRSALYAKNLRVNNEYIITDQIVAGKKKKSVTVMDKATGVEQTSLRWSDGLHQFLQFKHGLELSSESLKAVFLSNYFFFQRYGQHIYGLSGTLGSDSEQKYLKNLYNVDLSKIPRFNGEKYVQNKNIVTGDDEEWLDKTAFSVRKQIKDLKRAVLIISDSIEDSLTIESRLKNEHPMLQTYISSNQELSFTSNQEPTPVAPGDLIIATNLAGRGTDLKTTQVLEANGGLHVILSYIPDNIRIQEQAFGRTARSVNKGSGEFIIKDPHHREVSELCRIRDFKEKQRLEVIALKEIKKIEFENELLRGFSYHGEQILGFQSMLENIKKSLEGEEEFYREAQLNSLKNRWAFWIDYMGEKISMVYVLGKKIVVDSYKEFQRGVHSDFDKGGFRLIKEPIELIKLGGEYRRKEKWSEAENCYAEAANDPHYHYVLYYKAACQLIKAPSSSLSAKIEFKKDAKKAVLAIKSEISEQQITIQNLSPLVEQRRLKGETDYGNPYKTRGEEKIQVWSIFLSAIESAIGGSLLEADLKKSKYVNEENVGKILTTLGDQYLRIRLSKRLEYVDKKLMHKGKEVSIPKMLHGPLPHLKGGALIDKKILSGYCNSLVTKKLAGDTLKCKFDEAFKLSSIPTSFKAWPPECPENIQFVLRTIVEECRYDIYDTENALKEKLREKITSRPVLSSINIDAFFTSLCNEKDIVVKDKKLNLAKDIVKDPPEKFKSLADIKKGFTDQFHQLPPELQEALTNACREKEITETGSYWYLKSSIYLDDLCLPESTDNAANILWTTLEEQEIIKTPKIKKDDQGFKKQIEVIKKTLEIFFHGHDELEKVVDSVFEIIESSFGMIYRLDEKKITAKFADIIRKFYHDHKQQAPEGLGQFIELGLETIADLIEKKDPPAWYEVVAVAMMGILQIVAGVMVKAFLPIAGELIGNALISTGMDDVMFAINSAVSGEFSWEDYGNAKVSSLKRSIISSAITCGISFGAEAITEGSLGAALDTQKLTGVERATNAGKVVEGSFNLGTHILKEVGRTFLSSGISQVASLGLGEMTKLISKSYEGEIEGGIKRAVDAQWHLVTTQAEALYDKLQGDESVQANIQECIKLTLKKMSESNVFDHATRASRQAIPKVSSSIKDKGWSDFVSYAPDIAHLGISISKLTSLVEDGVRGLAREVRETKELKTRVENPNKPVIKETFMQKFLEKKKKEFTSQLTDAFNGILNSAVYSPLISMGTKYLVEKAQNALLPESENEKFAKSTKHVLKVIETEKKIDEAFFDKILLDWKGADDEITELTEEELQSTPVNSYATIEDLKHQYGSVLKIYRDSEGHLFAQRPSREEYAEAIREGKASGDPEVAILSKLVHANIAMNTPDGKIKTYHENGEITFTEPGDKIDGTIYLKYESNDKGIGHVSWEGDNNPNPTGDNLNCLYDAIINATGSNEDSNHLRERTAETLTNDIDSKKFFHNWSLQSEEKQFVGKKESHPWVLGDWDFASQEPNSNFDREAFNRFQNRWRGAINVVTAIGEVRLGAGVTIMSGGKGAIIGVPLMAHAVDNLIVAVQTIYSGDLVEPYFNRFLQSQLGISPDVTQLINETLGIVGTLGGTYLSYIKATKATPVIKLIEEDFSVASNMIQKHPIKGVTTYKDFTVGPNGIVYPHNMKRSVFENGLKEAGLTPIPLASGKGTAYIFPDGSKMVRVMDANQRESVRASFSNLGKNKNVHDWSIGNDGISPYTWSKPQPPKGTVDTKTFVRTHTHIELISD